MIGTGCRAHAESEENDRRLRGEPPQPDEICDRLGLQGGERARLFHLEEEGNGVKGWSEK